MPFLPFQANRLADLPKKAVLFLFKLRNVDPSELIHSSLSVGVVEVESSFDGTDLGSIFGIDLETETAPAQAQPKPPSELKSIKKTPTKRSKSEFNLEKLTGNALKKHREQRKMTINEFAVLLGVTSTTIYRWEGSGKNILKLNERSKETLRQNL